MQRTPRAVLDYLPMVHTVLVERAARRRRE